MKTDAVNLLFMFLFLFFTVEMHKNYAQIESLLLDKNSIDVPIKQLKSKQTI